MFQRIGSGILVGLLVVLSCSAYGQASAYFGPHLGIQKSHDAENTNYLVGATLRLKLMSILGAEGSIGYRQEKYAADAVKVKTWPVTATGLLYLMPVLYGGVGAGWYNTTFDYSDSFNAAGFDDETVQEFGWHLVGGLELPVSPSVSVIGDVRYVFIDYEFKDLPDVLSDDVNSDFYSITAGLLFRL